MEGTCDELAAAERRNNLQFFADGNRAFLAAVDATARPADDKRLIRFCGFSGTNTRAAYTHSLCGAIRN